MELRQLEMFIGIADAGAYSRASMRLSISQPILSRRVKALEQELGVALFHRTGRGVLLTEAGTLLAQYAAPGPIGVTRATGAVRASGAAGLRPTTTSMGANPPGKARRPAALLFEVICPPSSPERPHLSDPRNEVPRATSPAWGRDSRSG